MRRLENYNKSGGGEVVNRERHLLKATFEFVVRVIYQRGADNSLSPDT